MYTYMKTSNCPLEIYTIFICRLNINKDGRNKNSTKHETNIGTDFNLERERNHNVYIF